MIITRSNGLLSEGLEVTVTQKRKDGEIRKQTYVIFDRAQLDFLALKQQKATSYSPISTDSITVEFFEADIYAEPVRLRNGMLTCTVTGRKISKMFIKY